ncbi:MAG: GAF domain-containing protein [Cyanobacteria bacterium SBLK]|nr:GAF domain-containing protein [Cyanobacteria bacterium SBLK]
MKQAYSTIIETSANSWGNSPNGNPQSYQALAKVIDRIRRSLDIETIFSTTTREVRQLLAAERVAIFRFNPDWSGEFVAESLADGWTSLVRENHRSIISDSFLQENCGGRYRHNEIAIVNDIYATGFSPCHLELLEKLQARAYIIVPILQGETLWGLLAAYQNSQPRQWQSYEAEFLAQIGAHLGIALQQAEYLKQTREQSTQLAIAAEREKAAQRHKTLVNTIDKIRRSLDIETIFETTTREALQLLESERTVIYHFNPDWSGQIVAEALAGGWTPLMKDRAFIADSVLQETQGGRYRHNQTTVIDDIYESNYSTCHIQLLERLEAKACIIVPILQGETLWGLLATYQNSKPRHWQEYEVDLLVQIGSQLGIALQQAELLKTTQTQADELSRTLKELQQTQTQLIQSEKMVGLGQLVAGIAHEINNPVNFIFGNLVHVEGYALDLIDLIDSYRKANPIPNEEVREKIDDIDLDFVREDLPKIIESMRMGSDRIRKIVLSLRTFSRLDEAEIKAVDIHEGLESTLLILQHRWKSLGDRDALELVKDYGNIPLVECYPAPLNQVFMSLLTNALDAIEERYARESLTPRIGIRTAREGDRVQIEIADNGNGIPEEMQSRIFDPFFTTKKVGKGTGLGLAISYQVIVEKHGGQLEYSSQVGQGTQFRISIPIHRTEKF